MRWTPLLIVLLAGCAAPPPPEGGSPGPGAPDEPSLASRAFGDARVLAQAPDLWHIEGLAYHDGVVYAGTAFGAFGDPLPIVNLGEASRIFAWNRTSGDLVETLVLEGEDTRRPHGLTGLSFDGAGRLYGLSSQLGLVRWARTSDGWSQEVIAQLPDLQPCGLAAPPCSPTLRDEPPIGNDMTWGPRGELYVSDSFQAAVWRIEPNGDVALWYAHADLDRKFGPNGLRISPDGSRLVLAVTGPDSVAAGPVDRGSRVVAIPFPDPGTAAPEVLYTLPNGDLADGIVYGARGDLYVLSNAGNRLFIFPPGGGSPRVLANEDLSGDAAMDFPASAAFDGTGALLIANYAYFDGTADARGRTVLDIFVDDVGAPLSRPAGIEPRARDAGASQLSNPASRVSSP